MASPRPSDDLRPRGAPSTSSDASPRSKKARLGAALGAFMAFFAKPESPFRGPFTAPQAELLDQLVEETEERLVKLQARATEAEARAAALQQENAALKEQQEQQQREMQQLGARLEALEAVAAVAGVPPPTASQPPAPVPPPAGPELGSAEVQERMLCLEAVVPAAEGTTAEQAVAGIMDGAGILDGFDDAKFVGEQQQRDGSLPPLRTVRFHARTRESCVQLFRNKRAGIGAGRFTRLDQQLTPAERAERAALRVTAAFQAVEARAKARREGGKSSQMLWLPHGCVVGTEFWTLKHALAVDVWQAARRAGPT